MKQQVHEGPPANVDALQATLERKPAVHVPADFARRVTLRAAVLPQARERSGERYAQVIAIVVAVVVAVLLFALAPRTAASFNSLLFDLQIVVLLQLGIVAWWLVTRSTEGH